MSRCSEAAPPWHENDQALVPQHLEQPRDRGPPDVEILGEHLLSRHLAVRQDRPADNPGAQRIGELLEQATRRQSVQRYAQAARSAAVAGSAPSIMAGDLMGLRSGHR